MGFVTDELFLSSDICYFVQVRAMGEEAPMADMIQFNAYDGVPADDLARLYGDSFVSSFVIGGALTAVIAVKTGTKHSATRPTEAIETGFRTLEELAQQFGAGVRIWTQWEGARCTVQETICSGWTLDDLKKTIAGFHSARPVRIG